MTGRRHARARLNVSFDIVIMSHCDRPMTHLLVTALAATATTSIPALTTLTMITILYRFANLNTTTTAFLIQVISRLFMLSKILKRSK